LPHCLGGQVLSLRQLSSELRSSTPGWIRIGARDVFLTEERFLAANGFAISSGNEDRREPEPGQFSCRVWIKEVWHPAIKSGPDDDLADFAPI
jgi:hypothetical protein